MVTAAEDQSMRFMWSKRSMQSLEGADRLTPSACSKVRIVGRPAHNGLIRISTRMMAAGISCTSTSGRVSRVRAFFHCRNGKIRTSLEDQERIFCCHK